MNKLSIQQTLHGYNKGHRLLASSINLPTEAKKILQILSDLSGSNIETGFESYLTGYPIEEIHSYALAKTWYANEKQRPGCVWTHSLLIDFDMLNNSLNYDIFLQLFQRPIDSDTFKEYSQPINLNEDSIYNLSNEYNLSLESVEPILFSLYSYPEKSIINPSTNSYSFERLIVQIWNQQWPNLQKNFYFCTGSISNRTIKEKQFDLQIVPNKNIRKFLVNEKFQITNEFQLHDLKNYKWVFEAKTDLFASTKLRYFLKKYGEYEKMQRQDFILLVEIYIALKYSNQSTYSNIIEKIINSFPKSNEGVSIKKLLILNDDNLDIELKFVDIIKYLSYASTTEPFLAPEFINELKRLSIKNWNKDSYHLQKFLSEMLIKDANEIGEQVIEAIAQSIKGHEISKISDINLLRTFIQKNNNLAGYVELWKLDVKYQYEILGDLLTNANNDIELWSKIIKAILNNGNIDLVPIIMERLENVGIYSVLQWINDDTLFVSEKLDYRIRHLLGLNDEKVLNWLVINQQLISYQNKFSRNLIKLLPEILNPNSIIVRKHGLQIWIRIIESFSQTYKNEDLITFKAFLLALALDNTEPGAFELVKYSFEDVYKEVLEKRLNDFYSWDRIEPHTKPLGWKDFWDKGKKMRRALLSNFLNNKWPLSEFKNIFHDKHIFQNILEDFRTSKKFKNYVNLIN